MPKKAIPVLTSAALKKQLHYDPETGIFTWRVNTRRTKKGDIAGAISYATKSPTRAIKVNNCLHSAPQLAWLYYYGVFPNSPLGHRDKNTLNNAIGNLRISNSKINSRNAKVYKNNTSGVTGVYFCNTRRRWTAVLKNNYRRIHLGRFSNFVDAVVARYKAECDYNWERDNPASSAYLYLKKHGLL